MDKQFILLSEFVCRKREYLKMTQKEMSEKSGVGIRFIRELERGKETLKEDKVNQVLSLFGFELGPVNHLKLIEVMKKTKVYMYEEWAGTLIEDDEGFHFSYGKL